MYSLQSERSLNVNWRFFLLLICFAKPCNVMDAWYDYKLNKQYQTRAMYILRKANGVAWNIMRVFSEKQCIPRNSRPFKASTHVSAASYKAARSSVMLYFFFNFLDTKYIAAAPAYFTVNFSVKLKFPARESRALAKNMKYWANQKYCCQIQKAFSI